MDVIVDVVVVAVITEAAVGSADGAVSIICTKDSIFFLNTLFLSALMPFFLTEVREGGGVLGRGGGVLGRGGGNDKGATFFTTVLETIAALVTVWTLI